MLIANLTKLKLKKCRKSENYFLYVKNSKHLLLALIQLKTMLYVIVVSAQKGVKKQIGLQCIAGAC